MITAVSPSKFTVCLTRVDDASGGDPSGWYGMLYVNWVASVNPAHDLSPTESISFGSHQIIALSDPVEFNIQPPLPSIPIVVVSPWNLVSLDDLNSITTTIRPNVISGSDFRATIRLESTTLLNNVSISWLAESTPNGTSACPYGCNHGVCQGKTCFCQKGWSGTICSTCESNHWGPQCKPCECSSHGTCADSVTGSGNCSCHAGWWNSNCSAPCDCNEHGLCSPLTGCVCDDGWSQSSDCSSCASGFIMSGGLCVSNTAVATPIIIAIASTAVVVVLLIAVAGLVYLGLRRRWMSSNRGRGSWKVHYGSLVDDQFHELTSKGVLNALSTPQLNLSLAADRLLVPSPLVPPHPSHSQYKCS